MYKNKISCIIFIIPHVTLGDNMIILSLIEKFVRQNPQKRCVFFINNKFESLYRSMPVFEGHKIRKTVLNPWEYSNKPYLGIGWRRIITAWVLFRVTLSVFPNFRSTLVLGPDWMTSPTQDLDLFDSLYTRLISRAFIPNLQIREELQRDRRLQQWDHRYFLQGELKSIGFKVSRQDGPLIKFSSQTSEVRNFLLSEGVSDSPFILCFLGAGNESRDWTTHNELFLRNLASENFHKIVFVGLANKAEIGSLLNFLELVSLAKLIITNDTGWAHCVIEMRRPLLCISSIKKQESDSYIKESREIAVIRPDNLLGECTELCTENFYHCISKISYSRVSEMLKKLLGPPRLEAS